MNSGPKIKGKKPKPKESKPQSTTETHRPKEGTAPSAQSKKDLSHLVGRPLVPFFLPGGQEENTRLIVPTPVADMPFGGEGKLAVREFVDGYFEVPTPKFGPKRHDTKPEKERNNQHGTGTNTNTNHSASNGTQGAKKGVLSDKRSQGKFVKNNNQKPARKKNKVRSKEAKGPLKWAGPAFCNAPSPDKIPMPKLLSISPEPREPKKSRADPPIVMIGMVPTEAETSSQDSSSSSSSSKTVSTVSDSKTTSNVRPSGCPDYVPQLFLLGQNGLRKIPIEIPATTTTTTSEAGSGSSMSSSSSYSSLPPPSPRFLNSSFLDHVSRIPPPHLIDDSSLLRKSMESSFRPYGTTLGISPPYPHSYPLPPPSSLAPSLAPSLPSSLLPPTLPPTSFPPPLSYYPPQSPKVDQSVDSTAVNKVLSDTLKSMLRLE